MTCFLLQECKIGNEVKSFFLWKSTFFMNFLLTWTYLLMDLNGCKRCLVTILLAIFVLFSESPDTKQFGLQQKRNSSNKPIKFLLTKYKWIINEQFKKTTHSRVPDTNGLQVHHKAAIKRKICVKTATLNGAKEKLNLTQSKWIKIISVVAEFFFLCKSTVFKHFSILAFKCILADLHHLNN